MKTEEKYKGLGLVELIISIGVAGIAIMVLMSMAANSMKESIRLERQDALTRLAQDGALVVRKHVENENHPEVNTEFSFNNGVVNRCYVINVDESSIEFAEPSVSFNSIEDLDEELVRSDNDDFHVDIIYDWESAENLIKDVYYLAYCISRVEDSASLDLRTYIGSVVTGYVDCRGCNILPYEHNIIVNLVVN